MPHVPHPADPVFAYLQRHCPEAVKAYLLWSENRACVEIARSHASTMANPEHGRLLVAANVEARRMAALEYLGVLGYLVDRARLALEAHDVPTDTRRALYDRIAILSGFAGDAMADVEAVP